MSIPILMHPPYEIIVPDISNWQNFNQYGAPTKIDYAKVATNPKVKAVMVKFGEGSWEGYPEDVALEQAYGFHNVGIPIIPYLFWHLEASPIDQARYFKRRVNKLSWLPSQFMVDIEDTDVEDGKPPKEALSESVYPIWIPKARKIAISVRDTMDAVSQEVGVPPLWYGGGWYQDWWVWLAGLDGLDMSFIKKYKLQCASYTSPYMALCQGFTFDQTLFWQKTSRPIGDEQIQGFPYPGALDINYWLKTEEEFNQYIQEKPGEISMSGIFDKTLSNKVKWFGAWLSKEDANLDVTKVCAGIDFGLINCVSQISPDMKVVKDTTFPIWTERASKPMGMVVDLDQDLFWKKEMTLPVFKNETGNPNGRNMWSNETLRAIFEQWRRNTIPDAEWDARHLNISANDNGWHPVNAIVFRESTLRNHGDVINGMWQTAVLDDLLKPLTTLMEGGFIPSVPIYLMATEEWYKAYSGDSTWSMKARLASGQLKGLGLIRKWGAEGDATIVTDKAPMAQPYLPMMEDARQYIPSDNYVYPWVESGVNYSFFVFSFNRLMVSDIFYPNNPVTPITTIIGGVKPETWYSEIGWKGSITPPPPPPPPSGEITTLDQAISAIVELQNWRAKLAAMWPTIPK